MLSHTIKGYYQLKRHLHKPRRRGINSAQGLKLQLLLKLPRLCFHIKSLPASVVSAEVRTDTVSDNVFKKVQLTDH